MPRSIRSGCLGVLGLGVLGMVVCITQAAMGVCGGCLNWPWSSWLCTGVPSVLAVANIRFLPDLVLRRQRPVPVNGQSPSNAEARHTEPAVTGRTRASRRPCRGSTTPRPPCWPSPASHRARSPAASTSPGPSWLRSPPAAAPPLSGG